MIKISVLIPAYNEEEILPLTVKALKASQLIDNIIVIDDGSSDNTYEVAKASEVETIKLNRNMGKGYAVRVGIERLISESNIIVLIDADLGHSAGEVEKLIIPLLKGECDVTIAKFKPPKKKGGVGIVKKVAKEGVRFFTGIETTSSLSGQRGFKVEVLEKIDFIPPSFGVEVSMLIDVLRLGYKIKEVDVNMYHRETGNDLKGIIHRGKQFREIFVTLVRKGLR